MARMPGASWRPIPASSTPMDAFDIVCIHTMVGSLTGTDAYFRTASAGVNSHFGTGADGTIYQWVDTAYRSAANLNGNHHIISIENADLGAGFPAWNVADGSQVPAFTTAQIEAIAQICAWAHTAHGIPLEAIPDARPGRRGIGYHRQGVQGYMVAGAELWSSHAGKVCPGDRRIAQIPQIIARAQQIVSGDDMPLNDADKQWLRDNVGWSAFATMPYGPLKGQKVNAAVQLRDLYLMVQELSSFAPGIAGVHPNGALYNSVVARIPVIEAEVAGLQAALDKLAGVVASGRDDLTAAELHDAVASAIVDAGEALRAVGDSPAPPTGG